MVVGHINVLNVMTTVLAVAVPFDLDDRGLLQAAWTLETETPIGGDDCRLASGPQWSVESSGKVFESEVQIENGRNDE